MTTRSRSAKSVWARLIASVGTNIIVSLFGLVSGVVLARSLGPTARGELAILLLWPQLASSLGSLGVDLSATYFSADPRTRSSAPATALRMALKQSVPIMASYALLVPLVLHGVGPDWLPWLLVALIPVDLVGLCAAHALNGRHDYAAFNGVRLVMAPLYAGCIVVFAALDALNPTRAALAYLGANAAVAAIAFVVLRRRHGIGRVDRELARRMRRFGLRAHFGRLSPQGLGLDLLVVALVLPARELGLFTAAVAFLGIGRILVASVGLVVFPETRAAELTGGGSESVRRAIVSTVALTAVAALLLWAVGTPLSAAAFGEPFRAAGTVAAVLATGEVARGMYALLIEGLRGAGWPTLTTVAEACNWVVFVVAIGVGVAVGGGLVAIAAAVAVASGMSLIALLVLAGRAGALGFLTRPSQAPLATGVSP